MLKYLKIALKKILICSSLMEYLQQNWSYISGVQEYIMKKQNSLYTIVFILIRIVKFVFYLPATFLFNKLKSGLETALSNLLLSSKIVDHLLVRKFDNAGKTNFNPLQLLLKYVVSGLNFGLTFCQVFAEDLIGYSQFLITIFRIILNLNYQSLPLSHHKIASGSTMVSGNISDYKDHSSI